MPRYEKAKLVGAVFDLTIDPGVQEFVEQLPVNGAGSYSHRLEFFALEFGLYVSVPVEIMADRLAGRFVFGFTHQVEQFLGPEG